MTGWIAVPTISFLPGPMCLKLTLLVSVKRLFTFTGLLLDLSKDDIPCIPFHLRMFRTKVCDKTRGYLRSQKM